MFTTKIFRYFTALNASQPNNHKFTSLLQYRVDSDRPAPIGQECNYNIKSFCTYEFYNSPKPPQQTSIKYLNPPKYYEQKKAFLDSYFDTHPNTDWWCGLIHILYYSQACGMHAVCKELLDELLVSLTLFIHFTTHKEIADPISTQSRSDVPCYSYVVRGI